MRVTVCEMPNDPEAFRSAWEKLCAHTGGASTDLVLLPEMPFSPWLAGDRPGPEAEVAQRWARALEDHERWIARLGDLEAPLVAATRPVVQDGRRLNQAFLWSPESGPVPLHHKRYLPEEDGFWEAGWYGRGDSDFLAKPVRIPGGRRGGGDADPSEGVVGALICTEIWFNHHAREYGEAGAHLLLCPRATLRPSTDKWIAGGRAAAVVSGAYCLPTNFAGSAGTHGVWGGGGWVVDPEEGDVLGVTSAEIPFLTQDIDLARAEAAKNTYPRYVRP